MNSNLAFAFIESEPEPEIHQPVLAVVEPRMRIRPGGGAFTQPIRSYHFSVRAAAMLRRMTGDQVRIAHVFNGYILVRRSADTEEQWHLG